MNTFIKKPFTQNEHFCLKSFIHNEQILVLFRQQLLCLLPKMIILKNIMKKEKAELLGFSL